MKGSSHCGLCTLEVCYPNVYAGQLFSANTPSHQAATSYVIQERSKHFIETNVALSMGRLCIAHALRATFLV